MTRWPAAAWVLLTLSAVAACGRPMAPDAHAQVPCEACHTGAAAGLAMSPAPASACAACHELGSLQDTVSLGGVRLSHVPHAEVAPGVALPCSGCHAHGEGGRPLVVEVGGCFTCHGDARAGMAAMPAGATCRACHAQPSHTALTESRAPIDHAQIVEQGISCVQCHYDVLRGGAGVPTAGCVECHGPPLPAFPVERAGVETLHRTHLEGDRSVACARCHDPPAHEIVGLADALALDCASCHPAPHGALVGAGPEWSAACTGCHDEAHRAQQMLYTGQGVQGVPAPPAEMFTARVTCRACHISEALAEPEGPARIAALNESCLDCHGPLYGAMLPRWKAAMSRRTADVSDFVASANRETRLRGRAGADSLVRTAVARLGVVLEGSGLHNVPFADALLRAAVRDVESAYGAAGLGVPAAPRMGPDPATTSCAHCHYGVEAATAATVFGQRFDHAAHVLRADVACRECHSPADYFRAGERRVDPEHGQTTVTAEQCRSCHHIRTKVPCVSCHDRARTAEISVPWELTVTARSKPERVTRTRRVSFRHGDHLEVECSRCHAPRRDVRAAAACTDCHTAHHADVADCTACHGSAAQTAHTVESHFGCTQCHARETLEILTPTRPFCSSCHTAQGEDHFPGEPCAVCHLRLSPAEVKQRILRP